MASLLLLSNAPIPTDDPFVRPRRPELKQGEIDQFEGRLSDTAVDYMTRMAGSVNRAETRIGQDVRLETQEASIGATDFSGGILNAGLYEVKYYAQITRAASTSSSLEVTISWTTLGVAQASTGTAITGNTTGTHQGGSTLLYADGAPIRYATTYGSVGATAMQYALWVTLMQVKA